MTISNAIGAACTSILNVIVSGIARSRFITPNILTLIGLLINVYCAWLYGTGHFFAGGLVLILANVFDMLDGRVARLRGRETKFGAFLDSTIDRYSDMLLYMGLLILYARLERTPHMVLVWMAAFGGFMTSYARARAESLIPDCTVGFMERPERLVLLILGAVANHMVAALWVIAVLANVTAVQRVVYTYFELKRGWKRPGGET